MGWFSKLFSSKPTAATPSLKHTGPALPLEELTRRLNLPLETLLNTPITYSELKVPKRSGGTRILHVPNPQLKSLQRTLLRKLLAKIPTHPNAHGFIHDRSIVTNAKPHLGSAVILRMDIQNFFPSSSDTRVLDYFLALNWAPEAAATLTKLTTYQNALPQGAPTSPILSNLLNFKLDERLCSLVDESDGTYTRYADDLTFSFKTDSRAKIAHIIQNAQIILKEFGYKLHTKKKLRIARQHQRMLVTGLVVNEKLNLPRATRRKLRAIQHHIQTNQPATLTQAQLAGWESFTKMIQSP